MYRGCSQSLKYYFLVPKLPESLASIDTICPAKVGRGGFRSCTSKNDFFHHVSPKAFTDGEITSLDSAQMDTRAPAEVSNHGLFVMNITIDIMSVLCILVRFVDP